MADPSGPILSGEYKQGDAVFGCHTELYSANQRHNIILSQ